MLIIVEDLFELAALELVLGNYGFFYHPFAKVLDGQNSDSALKDFDFINDLLYAVRTDIFIW